MNRLLLIIRALLLQAGWNAERMQALGFTYALLPLADRRNPVDRAAFIRRHLAYVNTNPALSGVLLGMVVREEERIAAEHTGEEEAAARVAALKRRFEGPLAALGDRTMWGWLRPLAGVLGALALLVLEPGLARGRAPDPGDFRGMAPLAVLGGIIAFYNVPYLAIRVWGTHRGLDRGGSAVHALAAPPGVHGIRWLQALLEVAGPIAFGALAFQLALAGAPGGEEAVRGLALVMAGFLIASGAARFGQPPERMAMGLLVLLLLAAGGRR